MPDAVIRADAVQAAPAGYKVPGAQEIVVKSVRAVVDGSGAATAFVAVLQLIDPAGNICWQAPTNTTIAAGGSADVSWFRLAGGGAAGAFANGGDWATMNHTVAAFADTSVTGAVLVDLPAGTLQTTNTTTFTAGVSGGIHGIQINAVGSYLISVSAVGFPPGAPAAGSAIEVATTGGAAVAAQVLSNEAQAFVLRPEPVALWEGAASQQILMEIGTGPNPLGTLFRLTAGQNTGGNVNASFQLTAQAISVGIP